MRNDGINRDSVSSNSVNSNNNIKDINISNAIKNDIVDVIVDVNKDNIVEVDFLECQGSLKKPYVKPTVFVQDMTINSFSAGLCGDRDAIVLNYGETTCKLYDEESGMTYFGDQCTGDEWSINIVNPNPQSPYAQLCYHRPLDSLSFFSS